MWNFSLLQILLIRDFQDSLLSTVTPRNFICQTLSKGVSSKIILVGKASMVITKKHIYFFSRDLEIVCWLLSIQ